MRLLPHDWANVRKWDVDDWYAVIVTVILVSLWTFAAVTGFISWWVFVLGLLVGAAGILAFLVLLSWLTKNHRGSKEQS